MFSDQFLTKATIFRFIDVFSVQIFHLIDPPQVFQVQAKILTIKLVFPEYLSVSYDYALTIIQKEMKDHTCISLLVLKD